MKRLSKILLIILSLILIVSYFTACNPVKRVLLNEELKALVCKYCNEKDSTIIEIKHDTIIVSKHDTIIWFEPYFEAVTDTVKVYIYKGIINSPMSELHCAYAISKAQVINCRLIHDLQPSDDSVQVKIKDAVRVYQIENEKLIQQIKTRNAVSVEYRMPIWGWIVLIFSGLLIIFLAYLLIKNKSV